MHESGRFRRQNLSEEVANTVRQMVVDGTLQAGVRINEVHLARELGVSRTPLREAVASLVREGTLVSAPRIGAFVKPLTIEDFDQVYSIRTLLDPEALRLAGLPRREQLDRLHRLNERIETAPDPDSVIDLDNEWHLLLIKGCPNDVLLELICDFMRRTRRYELALMRERKQVDITIGMHGEIIAALRKGELENACEILKRNMEVGAQPIRQWLISKGSK